MFVTRGVRTTRRPRPGRHRPRQLKKLHKLDLSQLQFVGESLSALRQEVGNTAAVLGARALARVSGLVWHASHGVQ
jgi:hypothetical protein